MEKLRSCYRDVAEILLSKLETRDLLQMKCVSKGWRELISDRSFVLNYSRQWQHPPLSGFFFLKKSWRAVNYYYDASYISGAREEAAKLLKSPLDFIPEDFMVTSSCNGLVCCTNFSLSNSTLTLHVGNPLTREWIELDWDGRRGRPIVMTLSSNPSRDIAEDSTDFKVATVCVRIDKESLAFHIYSSKTRCWKVSDSGEVCIMKKKYNMFHTEYVSVKGVMYWLIDADEILVFDVENELAHRVSTPECQFQCGEPDACIGESGGELHYVLLSEGRLQIWVLEDPSEGKWSSLRYEKSLADIDNVHPELSLNLQFEMTIPLAFKDGVFLLRVSDDVYLYDTRNDGMKHVAHAAEFGTGSMLDPMVVPYSMSLVPLNRP
ncbi:unnamed protein product [Linum trigynum]|uniref:F-box domain-containing protein n=2 Tax=Linum trigynum TaxID=586398 RepID=A0AAV2DFH1_9ROSI